MNKILLRNRSGMVSVETLVWRVRDWQRWAPYAAVAWSLVYAALGLYWAVSGRGFPYTPETVSDIMEPLLGRFGPGVAWIVVMMAGIPAAAMGMAMLRGVRGRTLRPLLITAGALLAGVLLLLMTGLNLLVKVGYIPLPSSASSLREGPGLPGGLDSMDDDPPIAVSCRRVSLASSYRLLCSPERDACLYCGRRDGPEGWNSPDHAARWGRIAVYVALVAPVFYALTRYAWALGFPLGMSEEYLRHGQESGTWISGLFCDLHPGGSGTYARIGAALG